MGGRLSVPKGPDGVSELDRASVSRPPTARFRLNSRTVVAPLAAVVMAGMLFVYTRTSIKAAKLNAQRHREADGGIMNWGNEHLRRRGYREKIDDKAVLKEAFLGSPEEAAANARSAEEARLLVEAKEELERLKKSKQNDDEK